MVRGTRSLSVLLLFVCSSGLVDGTFDSEDFDRKLMALAKVIDYVRDRPRQMNMDAVFGVTVAEANLIATLMHENAGNLDSKYLETFRLMLKLYDSTRRYLVDKIVPDNQDVRLLHDTLNNPLLWIREISWKNGVLGGKKPSPGLTYRKVLESIMQGEPGEVQSDRCLAGIVREKIAGHCRMTEECRGVLTRDDLARGYPLTHRLLIAKVIESLDCGRTLGLDYMNLTRLYCSSILQDLVDIEATGFAYNTRDLMMEEVVLCGMEGYLEFTGKHYEDLILSWSHPSGCFSSFGFHKTDGRPVRRSSLPTDFGCDSHATGLAAAALSLYVRENVENAFHRTTK